MPTEKQIEKLARNICWAEFVGAKPLGGGATYWAGVSLNKKAEYMRDAKFLYNIIPRLGRARVLDILENE